MISCRHRAPVQLHLASASISLRNKQPSCYFNFPYDNHPPLEMFDHARVDCDL
jgi:hypothetical protein